MDNERIDTYDAEELKSCIVKWIRDWFNDNGAGCNAVVGISGGKDSSVVAALCIEALGKDRVVGVLMPNYNQYDIGDAYRLCGFLDIKHIIINIGHAVDAITNEVNSRLVKRAINSTGADGAGSLCMSEQASVNLPCRIRMATLYAVSQSINGRVANTCNLSEDWVGYSTRYGDSVGDFSPISNLTTDEVIAIGLACGLPENVVNKTPSDGLCGKTDEENLGFTYKQLNRYIRTGVCEDLSIKDSIDSKHRKSEFKLKLMPSYVPQTDGFFVR